MTYAVDQVARDDARKALSMAMALETRFEEREKAAVGWRRGVGEKLDDLSDSVKGIYSRIWIAACSIIVLLIGMVGYLIDHKGL